MLISIIVPVYNVKEYLIKCLDSIAFQNLNDYEVIIVDDGSTDGSGELVDEYCKNLSRFTVYHKDNGGLMSAWMYGVEKAKGEYIGFVDSDDYIDENMFFLLHEKAIKTNADIIMCDRFDVIGAIIKSPSYEESDLREGLYSGDDIMQIKQMVFPLPDSLEITKARWNKIFKRSVFMPNLKYCQSLSKTFEDRYITPACIFSAESFYYVKKPLYYYVHRSGSNSGMYKPDLLEQIKRLYYVEMEMLKDKGILDKFRKNWEYVFIDYIRQYVMRNIQNVEGLKVRYESAKCLLNDNLVKQRLEKYGKDDTTKMGRIVYLSYKFNLPILLALTSYF